MPSLTLAYRPPYDWARALGFLAARAIAGVEAVHDGQWQRTIRWPVGANEACRSVGANEACGLVTLRPQPQDSIAVLGLSESLAPAAEAIARRVRTVFDFDCESGEIAEAFAGRPPHRPMAASRSRS